MTGKTNYRLAAFLLAATMTFSANAAAPDFRPTISWIADQRAEPGTAMPAIAFTIGDVETAPDALTLSATSSNPTLLPPSGVVLGGSGVNRTATITPAANQTGESTVTITVSDGTKTAATSFALNVGAASKGNPPPAIQGVPNGAIPVGTVYGPFLLVLKDAKEREPMLALTAQSSNPQLVPVANIVFKGKNYGHTVEVTPASGQSGRATITLSVSDGPNTTSTSFVLDVVASNTPPTVTIPANQIITLGTASAKANFTVGNAETAAGDLQVWASSSNTALLPNASIVLGGSGANRTVALTPKAGATGAATVRLTVCDSDLTTAGAFLLVVHNPASPAEHFQRARGIYSLGSRFGASYTTTFGRTVSLGDKNIRTQPFVDGYALLMHWPDVESGATPGVYDFHVIQNALNKLTVKQNLSLIIMGGEVPDYITKHPGVTTWTGAAGPDILQKGNLTYPVPWDPYVRERRRALYKAMAETIIDGMPLAKNPRLALLDPFLPGGHTGIRNAPGNKPMASLPGYTRAKFLGVVKDELETLITDFPGKFVQIGFWRFEDKENGAYGGVEAWEYVRQQLLAEFNGVHQPHVGFFMENLAAKRPGPGIDPYSSTPPTKYATPMYLSQNDTWTGFEMLTCWTVPWEESYVNNTLNGTPADAIEAGYNTYGTEYHEVYAVDIDCKAFQPALEMWHRFFATGATTVPGAKR